MKFAAVIAVILLHLSVRLFIYDGAIVVARRRDVKRGFVVFGRVFAIVFVAFTQILWRFAGSSPGVTRRIWSVKQIE
ncbi:MAG: hypothetical protein K5981_10180 [Clostridia bacterium]|nr:hypothetical protein [Clostridia bacterium]